MSDPLVSHLRELGFRQDMIEDRGDHFVVEGDIVISREALSRLAAQDAGPGLQQWSTDVLVDPAEVRSIVADLSGLGVEPEWQTAARQALAEWNKVNCSDVSLVEGSPGDIQFVTFNDATQPGTAARARFPLDAAVAGKPGDTVEVNRAYTGTPNDSLTKLHNMVHEIGHAIGFRHTNWEELNEHLNPDHEVYGANQVPGTPPTDAASVMNGRIATHQWSGFSNFDQAATRTLYPSTTADQCLQVSVSGPSQVWPYYTCYWNANPSGGSGSYSYAWFGNQQLSSRTIGFSNAGSDFTIWVRVTDAIGRQAQASRFVRVYQYGPSCG